MGIRSSLLSASRVRAIRVDALGYAIKKGGSSFAG